MKARALSGAIPAWGAKEREMRYKDNILRITFTELTRSDDGPALMGKSCYDQLKARKRINVIERGGGLGKEAEVEWASLPERFKVRYIAKYGNPEDALLKHNSMITFDEEAREFFAGYVLADGTLLKEAQQHEYLVNASVLNRLLDMVASQKRNRNQKGNRTPVSWDNIMERCEEYRESYGHTLPRSVTRLRCKMNEYAKSGYECLISGKLGNVNTSKITGEVAEWILAHKNSMNPVYSISQLFDLYNQTAPLKGWKPIKSVQTILSFLERPDIKPLWYAVEQGSQRANNLFLRQNRTIMASCRDALWYIDGTKVNLYFQFWNEKTRRREIGTTNCIYVMDAYSEVFVGWFMCEQETFRTTYEALRHAFERTGFMPYELVSDNQSGFTSKSAERWRAKLDTITHTTTPHNAKSKSIEAAFGRFQAEVLHQYINYTGGNITAKSSKAKIDVDRIFQNDKSLPTYEEVKAANEESIRKWNSLPHPKFAGKSRMEVYMASVNPQAIPLTDVVKEKVFYIATEKPSTFRASGIEVTLNGEKRVYEVFNGPNSPDLEWRRKNTGREFIVEYNPHDLSRVRLCIDDKNYGLQFNTWAEPYMYIHRAMQDQVEGERSAIIAGLNANKKEIVRRDLETRSLQMKYGVGYESAGYSAPLPQGVSSTEYTRFAEEIHAEDAACHADVATGAAEVLPETVGQIQKQVSNMTPDKQARYDALNRI